MDKSRRRLADAFVIASIVVAAFATAARAQSTGVLLFTDKEQIPLKAYAELMRAGILRLTFGSAGDIPTVSNFRTLRTSLTGWRPVAVMVATDELFKSEYAERRMTTISTRPVGVTAQSVRVADLEKPDRIAELKRAVGAPERGEGVYFFLVYTSGDLTRYYPFRVNPPAEQ